MAFRLAGLDGVERSSEDVFESCRIGHRLDAITGFVIRRTYFGGARAHRDVAQLDGATSYGDALARVNRERAANDDGYAVIDTLYECGCRGLG